MQVIRWPTTNSCGSGHGSISPRPSCPSPFAPQTNNFPSSGIKHLFDSTDYMHEDSRCYQTRQLLSPYINIPSNFLFKFLHPFYTMFTISVLSSPTCTIYFFLNTSIKRFLNGQFHDIMVIGK